MNETTKQRRAPTVCGRHAPRHADATCQAQCFACRDCHEELLEALRWALVRWEDHHPTCGLLGKPLCVAHAALAHAEESKHE